MTKEELNEAFLPSNATSTSASNDPSSKKCHDIPFAILFYIHLLTVISIAFAYGTPALARNTNDDDDASSDFNDDFIGLFKLTLSCAGVALLLSMASMLFMISCSRLIIQLSLAFCIIISLIICISAFSAKHPIVGSWALVSFLSSLAYAYCVRKRIPFAAANLTTGLTAVQQNCSVTLIAYFVVLLCFVYALFWSMAFIGSYDQSANCDKDECTDQPNAGVLFIVFLVFFWTQQVLTNVVHVTVAGTVGNWWHNPNESSCVSNSILSSFKQSITYSFGSICFGSLFVAFIQTLRTLVEKARQNDEGNNCLLCMCNCILRCIEGIFRFFNKWAFVYVGIYNHSFITSAKSVVDLFKEKGWDTIINDDLVTNALFMVNLINALIVACIGQSLSQNKTWFNDTSDVEYAGFGIGFVVGYFMCSIMFGVVESAVNTVLVLFAEAPFEFRDKHSALFDKMTNAWSRIYPDHLPTR